MQLTVVRTGPQRSTVEVPLADLTDLDVALDAAYELLVAGAAGDGGLRPQEQLQVWQDAERTGTRLGTLTILPRPNCFFEYRAAGDR